MKAYVIEYHDNTIISSKKTVTVIAKSNKEMSQKFDKYIENGKYKFIKILHETEVIQ